MFRIREFLAIFSILLLLPLASNSEAILWDLQIQANVDNAPLFSGDIPIVSGMIIDHASKPVPNATVNIRSEMTSVFTTTNQSGEFQIELENHDRIPGNYVVNISATTLDDKTGIASIQFQVKGELSPTTVNQEKLSTPEAKKYLQASPEEFDKNPIGYMLYNYYQKIYQEYLDDERISNKLIQDQNIIEEQKETVNKLRLEAIEEFNPSFGIFTGSPYENYVDSLDDEVRETVVEHLNFTKNLFEEAQNLKKNVLENGGTAEEAQIAYLEKLTVTRDMLENFGNNSTNDEGSFDKTLEPESLNKTAESRLPIDTIEQHNDENLSPESPIQVNVDGINVKIDYKESIFYVNVNGTVLEFLVNGTEINRVDNQK